MFLFSVNQSKQWVLVCSHSFLCIAFADFVFQPPSVTLLDLLAWIIAYDINVCRYAQDQLVAKWFHSRMRPERGKSMFTFKWSMLIFYFVWSITLFEVKLVRVHKTTFLGFLKDFPISEVRLEAWISYHHRSLVSFLDALKYNFEDCWMEPFIFEVSLVRLPAKLDSFRCVIVVTRVRLQCGSLIAFLFDEKGLTKSSWPPCALWFFQIVIQAFPKMSFFATLTLQFGLHCGACERQLRLSFNTQSCANYS